MTIRYFSNPEFPLNDIVDVGVTKALGYLLLEDFEKFVAECDELFVAGPDGLVGADKLTKILTDEGNVCLQLASKPVDGRKIFCAFNPPMVMALLRAHAAVLRDAAWPSDPEQFVRRAVNEIVELDSPVFDVITLAYGNEPIKVREEIAKTRAGTWSHIGNW